MKKILFLIITFITLSAIIIYVTLDMERDEALSVRDFHEIENIQEKGEFELLGQISAVSFDEFTLVDVDFPENEVSYFFDEDVFTLDSFSLGDLVVVKGIYDEDISMMKAKDLEKVDSDRALTQLKGDSPVLKPSIIDYPENIEDVNEDFEILVELENTSEVSISFDDVYDESFGYTLIYKVNDEEFAFHPFEDFGEIGPGEVKEAIFTTNDETKSAMQQGENSIQFIWGKKSLYEEDYTSLFNSETVNIFVE